MARSIETEKALRPTHTHDRVLYWLEQFRGGDIQDSAYRKILVYIFVNVIYLYDHPLKITLNFAGNNNAVDLVFIENTDAAGDPRCSYAVENGPPK